MNKFLIIGGDLRLYYLSELLKDDGYTVISKYNKNNSNLSLKESIEICDYIICPLPFTKDNINIFSLSPNEDLCIQNFLKYVNNNHTIFGGNIPNPVKNELKKKCIKFYDLSDNNEICIKNAIATAEGAIAEAIKLSNINLHKSHCLITGYGRCGSVLAQKLKGLDTYVTIADKCIDQVSKAYSFGFDTLDIDDISCKINKFDFVFNTIPELILDKNVINLMKKEITIIDIASNPGGTDWDLCNELGINAHNSLGLPGKYSPKSSAEILYNAISKNL